MLKFLILSTVLLNRFCIGTFVNATKDLVEAQMILVEISSTVSPLGSPVAREFKKSLKCIGDLECKGQLKLTKFQLDTTDFYTDRVLEDQECIEDEEISKSLGNCVVPFKGFQFPKGFSSTVVPCVKKVLEGTDCSTYQKVGLERGAHAMSDLYDHLDMVFADISYAINFDLNFDPRKYGL
ncbi:hypothetical protein L5515_006429 [Caenorhabditis briggsae]|uniref:Uncharacterized protein n=1 Tax=Caenorhabditis briggsae TaxID=6238 RepID=A0AAE9JJI8_CAEBR|nr:hypothetical protein L5515_006429 [Caenorhabditis briggsae]